jgi:hypothetical protein
MNAWRPLPTAIAYALVGPLIGALLTLALFSPAIVNLGPFADDAFFELLFGAYVIGALPLALTGLLIARPARAGSRLPTLTLLAALLGLVLTALSAIAWIEFGLVGNAGWSAVLAIAIGGAVSAFAVTLVVAALAALFARARAAE